MIRAARAFRMISAARHSATASWARCPLHFRHLTQRASTADWNQEWSAAGLGAKKAPAGAVLNRLLFVQTGFGCDQHGDRKKGCTKAAVRAVRDAISFNSIPGMVHAVPGGRDNMLIHLKLGLPLSAAPTVDLDEVASCFPYGKLLPIEVVEGGLTFGCGRVVPELGDNDDTALIAVAAISLGYHDVGDTATTPRKMMSLLGILASDAGPTSGDCSPADPNKTITTPSWFSDCATSRGCTKMVTPEAFPRFNIGNSTDGTNFTSGFMYCIDHINGLLYTKVTGGAESSAYFEVDDKTVAGQQCRFVLRPGRGEGSEQLQVYWQRNLNCTVQLDQPPVQGITYASLSIAASSTG